jgi:hypothetical protein
MHRRNTTPGALRRLLSAFTLELHGCSARISSSVSRPFKEATLSQIQVSFQQYLLTKNMGVMFAIYST